MTAQTVRTTPRPGSGRSARFRLDVDEWLVLRAAALDAVPGVALPADFVPAAFGRDEASPMTEAERRRAWDLLAERGLARYVPDADHLDALVQPFAAGLMTLALADVRVDVRSWSGRVGLAQSTAWRDGHTVALSRRRRLAEPPASGEPRYEQEGVVELSLASDGHLIEELLRALPTHDAPGPVGLSEPVTVGWELSHAVADAMRHGRQEVVPHLIDLSPDALSALGALATTMTGGAQVLAYRSRRSGNESRPEILAFEGVWVWTTADVIELITATREEITLQRTSVRALRTRLLSALTRLLHADEVL